jgi:hypothetical protein
MRELAERGVVGMIAHGRVGGVPRGYVMDDDGLMRSDRAHESALTADELIADASAGGGTLTFTLVPAGTQVRMGIDRDDDGILDGDE